MDIAFLKNELEYFRKLGIKIAIDDFGTGNATLNLLTELPIDELKVDMSLSGEYRRASLIRSLYRRLCPVHINSDTRAALKVSRTRHCSITFIGMVPLTIRDIISPDRFAWRILRSFCDRRPAW